MTAEVFNPQLISGDLTASVEHLRSLSSVFDALGQSDFRMLETLRAPIMSAYESCAEAARLGPGGQVDNMLGELGLIVASLELRETHPDVAAVIAPILNTPWCQSAVLRLFVPAKFDWVTDPEFYDCGTTSFIFKVQVPFQQLVLKAVAAPYCFDQRITRRTREYVETYEPLFVDGSIAVKAHSCGDRFILMDFVDGDDFNSACNHRLGADASLTSRLELADAVGNSLFQSILMMERHGLSHNDLNPRNLICNFDMKPPMIRLVDFGRSYTLTEGLGSASAIEEASRYVAPEVSEGVAVGSPITGDVFSIGRLLLDVLQPENRSGVSRAERLHGLYQEAPSLGGFVETLTSRENSVRVDPKVVKGAGSIAGACRESFKQAMDLAKALETPDGELTLTRGRGIGPALTGGLFTRVRQLRRIAKLESSEAEDKTTAQFLFKWAVAVWIGFMFAWLLFAILTLRDASVSWGPVSLGFLLDWVSLPADSNSFSTNLAGRLVILSFVTISAHYYMNIFSGLNFRRIPGRLFRLTEVWMRFAGISCLPLALFIFFVDPTSWAILSFIGVSVIGINNKLVYRSARRIVRWPTTHGALSHSLESGRADLTNYFEKNEFGSWSTLIFQYGAVLLVVGILLRLGLAQDLWVYVSLIVAMNVFKLDDSNCIKQAPKVRGYLARVLALATRGGLRSSA